jgi:DNA adenine methylase
MEVGGFSSPEGGSVSGVLKAPFPWFGGKSRVAHLVWERFGDVPNYVEPFAGSLAVLLGRPHASRVETVNDADALLVNFWRAVRADPASVARWADWPLTEVDLAARHGYQRAHAETLADRLRSDPEVFDVQLAGWWVWGLSGSIGEAWLRTSPQRPAAAHPGGGILSLERPGEALGRLQARLARTRVLCGDWTRTVTPTRLSPSPCAVFLDPPYSDEEHGGAAYATRTAIATEVREWALEHGDDPSLRIALCGYDGEHEMPATWSVKRWKAMGGFGSRTAVGRGRENAARETIWFSPHCLKPSARAPDLFDLAEAA